MKLPKSKKVPLERVKPIFDISLSPDVVATYNYQCLSEGQQVTEGLGIRTGRGGKAIIERVIASHPARGNDDERVLGWSHREKATGKLKEDLAVVTRDGTAQQYPKGRFQQDHLGYEGTHYPKEDVLENIEEEPASI